MASEHDLLPVRRNKRLAEADSLAERVDLARTNRPLRGTAVGGHGVERPAPVAVTQEHDPEAPGTPIAATGGDESEQRGNERE